MMFDLDGTLVDTTCEITLALNAVLVERGLPAVDEGAARARS